MIFVFLFFFWSLAIGGDPTSKGGQIIQKFGERVRKLLTKFWIWIVTITLFAIGILDQNMNLFRIIYMGLALFFVVTFQVNYDFYVFFFHLWRTFIDSQSWFSVAALLGHLAQNHVRILVSCDYHLHDNTSHDIHIPVRRYKRTVGKYRRQWRMVGFFSQYFISIFIFASN